MVSYSPAGEWTRYIFARCPRCEREFGYFSMVPLFFVPDFNIKPGDKAKYLRCNFLPDTDDEEAFDIMNPPRVSELCRVCKYGTKEGEDV